MCDVQDTEREILNERISERTDIKLSKENVENTKEDDADSGNVELNDFRGKSFSRLCGVLKDLNKLFCLLMHHYVVA